MDYEYRKIPKIIEKREYYEDGANIATQVTVHKCFCKRVPLSITAYRDSMMSGLFSVVLRVRKSTTHS